jgi:3-oxoacyl-(acyl-carrier-protein) synthase
MDVFLTGAGWITPHGTGLEGVWSAIAAGTPPPVKELPGPQGRGPHLAAVIPPKLADAVGRNPRLRRSSNISLYAATAVLAAMRDAGMDPAAGAGRCALVFAVCDGGVIYTRKFYDQVVREHAGSPLLFPETVYNAPASHIAALLGMDGMTYTLVGDASAGIAALRLGADLVASGQVDACIVAGAEEADWILAEAYSQWGLAGKRGALIADGAAAVVLGRAGRCRLDRVTDGVPFFRQAEAQASLAAALGQLPAGRPGRIVSSANGTFVDRAEEAALKRGYGGIPMIYPKASVGDAFGASALMQIICAMRCVRDEGAGSALATVIGLNHQAAAALVCG